MLFAHAAAIWDIAASQGGMGAGVHGLVLSVGSDGICTIVSSTDRILRVPLRQRWRINFIGKRKKDRFSIGEGGRRDAEIY